MLLQLKNETICARATPPGASALAIVRLSGPRSVLITRKVCPTLPLELQSHHSYLTAVKDEFASAFDEVLVTCFLDKKAFTGEESVEFSVHGNDRIVDKLLRTLIQCGARMAMKGEFTFRAFVNGRLDLLQAESVLSMIEAPSEQSLQIALNQLHGNLSQKIQGIETEIIFLLAHLEAEIDFSQENLETLSRADAAIHIKKCQQTVNDLLKTANLGKHLREGIRIVLAGKPNVGKSSLLNLIAQSERALVSEEAGTTRDFIEIVAFDRGLRLHFIDTAGLREGQNSIEKGGIAKTNELVKGADLVLLVVDDLQDIEVQIAHLDQGNLKVLLNKADQRRPQAIPQLIDQRIFVLETSSFWPESREAILETVHSALPQLSLMKQESVLLHERQVGVLSQLAEVFSRALILARSGESPEFVSLELRDALLLSQELLGKRYDDQIIDQIFKQFCLGK